MTAGASSMQFPFCPSPLHSHHFSCTKWILLYVILEIRGPKVPVPSTPRGIMCPLPFNNRNHFKALRIIIFHVNVNVYVNINVNVKSLVNHLKLQPPPQIS